MTNDALDRVLTQLKIEEGFRSKPYKDSTGHLTIGYGTNLDAGITTAQAQALLTLKFLDDLSDLQKALPWVYTLDDVRLGVLAQMAYNLGISGLLEFTQMLAHAKAGDWAAASLQLKASVADRQEPARVARWAQELATGVQA